MLIFAQKSAVGNNRVSIVDETADETIILHARQSIGIIDPNSSLTDKGSVHICDRPIHGAEQMILSPLVAETAWINVPSKILRTFNGRSCLPVFEIGEGIIQRPKVRIRPLTKKSKDFPFNSWRLAHAIMKADCARWPYSNLLRVRSVGFLLEYVDMLDWDSSELRLSPGMTDYYADFSRTSIAGRIGQGMALLFLEDEGYTYVGRFETIINQFGSGRSSSVPSKNGIKKPDFVVESGVGKLALAEAKGSFVPVGGYVNIKGALNAALEQLHSGAKQLTPQPSKSFAVGTFLRDTNDNCGEPSLIAYTDPPPDEAQEPVEYPKDAIRRANYASWLSLMGFGDSAQRLWKWPGDLEKRSVATITLGEYEYVVTITGVQSQYGSDLLDGTLLLYPDSVVLKLVGLELGVVKALGAAIQGRSLTSALKEIELIHRRREIPREIDGGEFYGSVLSDFSLLGEIRVSRRQWPDFRRKEIAL